VKKINKALFIGYRNQKVGKWKTKKNRQNRDFYFSEENVHSRTELHIVQFFNDIKRQ